MVAWPDAAELKQVLDVTSDDWDDTLDRVLAAAIYKVQEDVGEWDEYVDVPDESLAQAALRMGELMALKPEVVSGLDKDPTYQRLMFGHHKRFAVS